MPNSPILKSPRSQLKETKTTKSPYMSFTQAAKPSTKPSQLQLILHPCKPQKQTVAKTTSVITQHEIVHENVKIHQYAQKKDPSTPEVEEEKLCMSPTIKTDVTSPILEEQLESKLKPLTNITKAGRKEMIGDYVIGKVLGTGAYGQVKVGTHLKTGKKVAIKIIVKRMQRTEKALKRIAREIEILQSIKHPNVIECYDVLETEKAWYMILEYCSGGELFDYIIGKERLTENEAAEFFVQLIDGIEYLHQNGIAHRDIKLENILLDDNNRIKIADFGMSRMYTEAQTLQTRCGSPHYLSPEMLHGKPYSPLPSDIWSCGVILYGMVAGYMPFDEENNADIFDQIMKGKFDQPEDTSEDCQDLISRILDTNVMTRITIPEIRQHVLMCGNKKQVAICIEELL